MKNDKHFKSFSYIYLLLIQILRIDLSRGASGFVLTPFILMSLYLYFALAFDIFEIKFTALSKPYLNMIIIFGLIAFFCIISIFHSESFNIGRLLLFLFYFASSIIYAILFSNSSFKIEILKNFVKTFLIVYVIFSVIQVYFFFGWHYVDGYNDNIIPGLQLYGLSIGTIFPRPSGGLVDANIAGYFLIFILILSNLINYKPFWVRFTIFLFVILTLSRSTMVIYFFIIITLGIIKRLSNKTSTAAKINYGKIALYCIGFIGLVAAIIINLDWIENNFILGLVNRFSNSDGSSDIHHSLIELAFKKAFDNVYNFLFGYGFGSSPSLVGSIFGGSKYGNFHTEFLTIIVENGFLCFVAYATIFIYPIINNIKKNLKWLNLLVLLFYFCVLFMSVYYQQYIFPHYWFFLALFWNSKLLLNIRESAALQSP